MRKSAVHPSVPILSLAATVTPYALAQAGAGTIQGVVRDSSGASISGAAVIATNTATGVQVTRQTTGEGFYSIAPLPTGEYSLRVTGVPGLKCASG